MDSPTETRSRFSRFLDAFLQERNIKWILAAGVAIVLGSTVMLVGSHWQSYAAWVKQAILLGGTSAVYAAGRWTYERMALRRTGTVLLALCVLLVPLDFAALRFVGAEGTLAGVELAFVWLMTAAATIPLARSVLRHFLRGEQTTFVASYLALSAATALAPFVPHEYASLASLGLWACFAAGVVKVNRRVFWLVEEGRQPRIFGFFPILLLGSLFLFAFVTGFAASVPAAWLGLGCALAAAPVLLTADTLARVVQQRTGGLVATAPFSVFAPFGCGLCLCVAGLALSTLDTAVFVPTAAMVGAMLIVAARRTDRKALVWAALLCLAFAYLRSPVFFAETARQAVATTATVVKEQRLPYAYYGLTFLPLLAAMSAAAHGAARRGSELFATPLRQFVVALAAMLLIAAPTHLKAMLPVGGVLTLWFATQTVLFRNRSIALLAIAAAVVATFGASPFAIAVLEIRLPDWSWLACLNALAAGLLAVGPAIDRRMAAMPARLFGRQASEWADAAMRSLCQRASVAVAVAAFALWCVGFLPLLTPAPLALGLASVLLLAIHAVRGGSGLVGGATIGTGTAAWLLVACADGATLGTVASILTMQLSTQWGAAHLLRRRPTWRVTRAFAAAAELTCLAGMGALVPAYLGSQTAGMIEWTTSLPQFDTWAVCAPLVFVWAIDAARREARRWLAATGYIGLLLCASNALSGVTGVDSLTALPALWSAAALAAVWPAVLARGWAARCREAGAAAGSPRLLIRAQQVSVLTEPLETLALALAAVVAIGSLASFAAAHVAAGLTAAAAVALWAKLTRRSGALALAAAAVNWRLISALAPWFDANATDVTAIAARGVDALVWTGMAAAAALGAVAWEFWPRQWRDERSACVKIVVDDVVTAQQFALRLAAVGLLFGALHFAAIGTAALASAAAAFVLVAAAELVAACREQSEPRVVAAEAVVAAGVGFLARYGAVDMGATAFVYATLIAGLAVWAVARGVAGSRRLGILRRPLQLTGLAMPLAAVAGSAAQHAGVFGWAGADEPWIGVNSLAILLAAGFYFWQGLEQRRKSLLLLAGGLVNLALALLWRELEWSDPQFYLVPVGASILGLVQLLREQIPPRLRDPLRYAGALVILVSPTLHIVGSFSHMICLLAASVAVVLLAIGLRTRPLLYAGTAFLLADLVAMVVHRSADHPNLPWVVGLAIGAGVVGLGALCELKREQVQQRVRSLAAALETWE